MPNPGNSPSCPAPKFDTWAADPSSTGFEVADSSEASATSWTTVHETPPSKATLATTSTSYRPEWTNHGDKSQTTTNCSIVPFMERVADALKPPAVGFELLTGHEL